MLNLFVLCSILVFVEKVDFQDKKHDTSEAVIQKLWNYLLVYFSNIILGLLTITAKVCKLLSSFYFYFE